MKQRIIAVFLCMALFLVSIETPVYAEVFDYGMIENQDASMDIGQLPEDFFSDSIDYDESESVKDDILDNLENENQQEISKAEVDEECVLEEDSEKILYEENIDEENSVTMDEETFDLVSPITDENYSMVLASDSGEYGIAMLADNSNSCGPDVYYQLDSNGTLTISGRGNMTQYMSSESIPWRDQVLSVKAIIIESGVTSISNFAFWNCKQATTVKIAETVKTIGISAFGYCQSLTQISLPASVTSIDSPAFNNCYNLQKFTVATENANYCSADDGILYDKTKNTLICYPIGKTSATYTIPKTIRYIESGAFTDNRNISKILVESGNTSFSSDGGILFNNSKNTLIRYPIAKTDETYSVPSSVRYISDYSFYNCDNLKNITFSEGVQSIGEKAFGGCDNLRYLEIPDSVNSLGMNVFWTCRGLLTVRLPLGITELPFAAFYDCDNLKEIEIPNRVGIVSNYAFNDCNNLVSVYFRQNTPSIEPLAFTGTEFSQLSVSGDDEGWSSLDDVRFGSLTGFYKEINAKRYQWITYTDSDREVLSLFRDTNIFSHGPSIFGNKYIIDNPYYAFLISTKASLSNPIKYFLLYNNIKKEWGGSCAGVAASILATLKGRLMGFSGGLHYYNLNPPYYAPPNEALNLINYYQVGMNYFIKPEKSCTKQNKLPEFLAYMVSKAENNDLYALGFNYNYNLDKTRLNNVRRIDVFKDFENREGHSVVVFGAFEDEAGNHVLKIYDPNGRNSLYEFVISADYRSFEFQDSNNSFCCSNNDFIKAVGQDNVDSLHLENIWTEFDIYSLDSIMNLEIAPADKDITEGHRDVSLYSLESDEPISEYATGDSEKVQIALNTNEPVTIRSKEGYLLTTNGENYSGTMNVYDMDCLGEQDYWNVLTVDSSDSFTVQAGNKPIKIIIQTKDQTYYAETDSAETLTVSITDGMVINGNSAGFSIGVTTDIYDSSLVFIDGVSGGDISLKTTAESVQVSSSGYMTDLVIHDTSSFSDVQTRIPETVSSLTLSQNQDNGITIEKEISFAVDQTNLELKPGQTKQIHPVTEGVSLSDIEWSSSDKSVATVSQGLITAVSEGNATIKAETSDGRSAIIQVKVLSPSVLFLTGTSKYDYSFKVLELLNAERKSRGLTELKMDEKLFEDANQRAAELAVNYSHTRPDGSSCLTINKYAIAENIAAGNTALETVFNGWMQSEGHRQNMLAEDTRGIGIGCFSINGRNYWVQLFSNQVQSEIDSSAKYSSVTNRYSVFTGETILKIYSVLNVTVGIEEQQEMQVQLKNSSNTSFIIYPDNDSFVWVSDNPDIAEVSNGIVTGKKVGNTGVTIIYGNQGGPFYVTVTSGDTVIKKQPVSACGYVGDSVNFSITAENVTEYQWQYSTDGKDWKVCSESSANTDTLSLKLTEANATQKYRCALTDDKEKVTYSDIVSITLYKRVLITKQPQNAATQIGGSVAFSVNAENAVSYQWYYSQDNGKTWLMSTLTGAKTNTISFKLSESNSGNIYKCILTDNGGATVSTNEVKVENTSYLQQNASAIPDTYEIGVGLETLVVVKTSGVGKVTYTSSDPSILSINGMYWTGNKIGDVTVTVHFSGDAQYLPADVTFTMHVVEYIGIDSDSCGDDAVWTYYHSSWPQSEKKAYIVISGTGTTKSVQRASGHYLWDEYNREYYGNSLDHILVDEGITGIGDYFFACKSNSNYSHMSDSQNTISLADSVKTIGKNAFDRCSKLETVNIGAGLDSIGSYPFVYCTSLKNINVASQNKNFKSIDGCLLSKDGTILYKVPNKYKKYVVPNGVTTIETDALGDMLLLEEITLPATVKTIKSYAFDGTTNLKQIFYKGTEDSWAGIKIESGNTILKQAAIQYNSSSSEDAEITSYNISIFDNSTLRLNTYIKTKAAYASSLYVQTGFQDKFSETYETGDNWKKTSVSMLPVYKEEDGYTTYILSMPLNSGELTRDVLFRVQSSDEMILDQETIQAADLLYTYLNPDFEVTVPGFSADYYEYLRDVSKATLIYGACAQKYFGGWYDKNGTLADWNLSEAEKKPLSLTTQELVNGSVDYRDVINTENVTGIQYIGSSLLLLDEVVIRHYFAPIDNKQKSDYQFTLLRNGQKQQILTAETKDKLLYVEYPVIFSDIKVADTIGITSSGRTENFQYSLMNYIGMAQSSDKTDLKDLVTALYRLAEMFR